jgi:hypothetical protein
MSSSPSSPPLSPDDFPSYSALLQEQLLKIPPFSPFVGTGLSALDILDMIPNFEFKYPFDETLKNAVLGSVPSQYSSREQMVKYASLFSESKEQISGGNVRKAASRSLSLHGSPTQGESGEGNQEKGVKKEDTTLSNTPPGSPYYPSSLNPIFPSNVSVHYINRKQGEKEKESSKLFISYFFSFSFIEKI